MKLRIQVFLLECFVGIFRLCPKWMLSRIASIFRVLTFPFMKKDREKIYRNCEEVLKLPRHSQFAKQFCRQVLQHQIESGLESLVTSYTPLKNDPITILGLDELEATIGSLKESDKGVIVVTAHLGSWEFISRYCAHAAKETFVALAKPSKSKAVTEYMDRTRGRMNARVLWTDRKSLLKDMLKA